MTNKEALQGELMIEVPAGAVDKALADASLNPSDTYQVSNRNAIGNVAIELLYGIIMYSSEKEGTWGVGYSHEGIKARLLYLARKYGRDDIVSELAPQPKIRNRTNIW